MTSTSVRGAIPIVTSIAPFSRNRVAWLVDIWGVMHNGVRPYNSAVAACRAFRQQSGVVLLLSNAPRPHTSVATQLSRIGVSPDAYDGILTSGDAARALIQESAGAGERIAHLGPERDRALFDGIAIPASTIEAAQTVVCTGLNDDETETPQTYADVLDHMARTGARMICANPDITVERDGRIVYCAGAIAEAFARLGGRVDYAGKPHAPMYRLALERLASMTGSQVSRQAVLAIGDGVRTDIEGAAGAGLDCIYIASGIHLGPGAPLTGDALSKLFEVTPARPIAAMAALAW